MQRRGRNLGGGDALLWEMTTGSLGLEAAVGPDLLGCACGQQSFTMLRQALHRSIWGETIGRGQMREKRRSKDWDGLFISLSLLPPDMVIW
jgi:hypothetical protein